MGWGFRRARSWTFWACGVMGDELGEERPLATGVVGVVVGELRTAGVVDERGRELVDAGDGVGAALVE